MQQPEIEISKLDHNGEVVEKWKEKVIAMMWREDGVMRCVGLASMRNYLFYDSQTDSFVDILGAVTGKLCNPKKD